MFGIHKKKKIGLFAATSFAVGTMIGAGVFVLSGRAAQQAGPSAILSFAIAGVTVLLSALSLVYVGSFAKKDENAYEVVGKTFSPVMTLIVTRSFYVSSAVGAAFVLNAFGVYLQQFLLPTSSVAILAIVALVILFTLNIISTRIVGQVESVLVSVKLLILLTFVGFGLAAIHSSNLTPFFAHGVGASISTSATLFIAFLGFSTITSIASEINNPRKTIPRATMLSMLIVTVVYIGVSMAMLAANLNDYDEASVGRAAEVLMGPVGGGLVVLGALVATLSAANASLLGSSELMIRLAARKYVPTFLARQYRGHPMVSLAGVVIVTIILLLLGNVMAVIDVANVAAIVALAVIDLTAIKLSYSNKQKRRFAVAIVAFVSVGAQLFMIAPRYIVWGGLAILFGLLLYGLRIVLHGHKQHKNLQRAVDHGGTPLVKHLSH